MFETNQLLGFVASVMVLVLVPGPNTLIILAQSLSSRRAVGMATVAGVELGTIVHTIAAAFGLSALLSSSPLAFDIVKLAGVTYLLVVGIRTLFEPARLLVSGSTEVLGVLVAFRRALLTNLLNPKVALFFLAFLPQFVRPERGHLVLQFMVLGLIVSVVGLGFGSALVLVAESVTHRLRRHPFPGPWQQRVTGGVFIGLAVRLALT